MSTEIKSLDMPHMRNEAHQKFHFNTEELILEFNPNRLGIAALFGKYQAAIVREDDVFKKIVKSEFTEKIADADRARDDTYGSLTTIVNALQKHCNAEVKDGAKRVKIVFDTFGKKVVKKSYDEQTSAIYNILQELNGNYAADVELLRLTEMVAELERANNALDALMKTRLAEAAERNPDTMEAARRETDEAYTAIRKRINALVEVEGPENYAAFITKLNLLIDEYKLLITKSHHHAK